MFEAELRVSGTGHGSLQQALVEAALNLGGSPESTSPLVRYHDILASVHRLLRVAQQAEDAGLPFDELRAATEPARLTCARSSAILKHSQTWPRGYPGDFELIERLLDGPPGLPASADELVDRIVLALPVVEQHRAKVAWQAGIVRHRLQAADTVRVLSIACGGCRDLLLLDADQLARLSVVLNDVDADALALAHSRLQGKVGSIVCVQGNVLRRAARLAALGPFDTIVVGGLLDYLPQRPARSLLQRAEDAGPGRRAGGDEHRDGQSVAVVHEAGRRVGPHPP